MKAMFDTSIIISAALRHASLLFCHSCIAAKPRSENPSRGRKTTAKLPNARGATGTTRT
jgi:hypothetical protein